MAERNSEAMPADADGDLLAAIKERSGALPFSWYEVANRRKVPALQMNVRHLVNMLEESRRDIRVLLDALDAKEAELSRQREQATAAAEALSPFEAAYRLFFDAQDRGDKSLYWFENTSRQGKQHPKYTLFVEDFRRAAEVYMQASAGNAEDG